MENEELKKTLEDCVTTIGVMTRTITLMNERINGQKKRITEATRKVNAMHDNQRHYLRRRAPKVLKRQRELQKKTEQILKRLERVGKLNFKVSSKAWSKGEQHVLFMCTHNEARKLRSMLNVDFRQFNSCKPRPLTRLGYSNKPKDRLTCKQ
jgi:DNA repair ATPase RecN